MKEYQVKITPKAKDDMEEIYNYIAYDCFLLGTL